MTKTLEIHLKRFQPSKMQTNRICVMVGKKGTGKSTLVEDIMWYQQHIPVGAIMSATEEANETYSRMAPPLFIYKNFDADALVRLINRQKKMKALYKQNGDSLPFDHRAFVLMDDCMYDKKNFKGPLMRELFMNGRHWDLFVLITLQYVMDITPEIRTNTDYIFALKENVRKNRERLYNEFFGVFPSFQHFDALFLEVTQDWRCLVLDTTVPSTEIEDCVFWYKAVKRPRFRLGADWFWEYSAKNVLGQGESNADDIHNQLDEMNQKAVHVVFEGQKKKPPPPPADPGLQRGPSQIRWGAGPTGPPRPAVPGSQPQSYAPQYPQNYGPVAPPQQYATPQNYPPQQSEYWAPPVTYFQQPQGQRAAFSAREGFGGFV
jgi:hypothetical protein